MSPTAYPVRHFCFAQVGERGVDVEVDSKIEYVQLAAELAADGIKCSYWTENHSPLFTYFAQDDLPAVFRR